MRTKTLRWHYDVFLNTYEEKHEARKKYSDYREQLILLNKPGNRFD